MYAYLDFHISGHTTEYSKRKCQIRTLAFSCGLTIILFSKINLFKRCLSFAPPPPLFFNNNNSSVMKCINFIALRPRNPHINLLICAGCHRAAISKLIGSYMYILLFLTHMWFPFFTKQKAKLLLDGLCVVNMDFTRNLHLYFHK